jgi:hypothetical protein
VDDKCHVFLKPSEILTKFEFPIDIMCNAYENGSAIDFLAKKAESSADFNLANQIAGDMQAISINKKLRFTESENTVEFNFVDMNGFYAALKDKENLDEEEILIIQTEFLKQRIKFNTLSRLTDEILKEDGITQRGLREAILNVLGK